MSIWFKVAATLGVLFVTGVSIGSFGAAIENKTVETSGTTMMAASLVGLALNLLVWTLVQIWGH
jgi:hypothetical protein